MTDLNQLLVPLLEKASLTEIEAFVQLNLRPEVIIDKIKETGRYNALPSFLPMLIPHKQVHANLLELCATILEEGNEELFSTLKTQLAEDISFEELFAIWGRRGFDFATICLHLPERRWSKEFYAEGLVEGDHAERFEIEKVFYSDALACLAARHFSKKCMDYWGYAKDRLICYIDGALRSLNKECLEWLLRYPETEQILKENLSQTKILQRIEFLQPFIRCSLPRLDGYINMSKEDWESLARKNMFAYETLRCDV